MCLSTASYTYHWPHHTVPLLRWRQWLGGWREHWWHISQRNKQHEPLHTLCLLGVEAIHWSHKVVCYPYQHRGGWLNSNFLNNLILFPKHCNTLLDGNIPKQLSAPSFKGYEKGQRPRVASVTSAFPSKFWAAEWKTKFWKQQIVLTDSSGQLNSLGE